MRYRGRPDHGEGGSAKGSVYAGLRPPIEEFSMEKEAKANRRCCFMGENCRAHASIQTV